MWAVIHIPFSRKYKKNYKVDETEIKFLFYFQKKEMLIDVRLCP